MNRTSLMIFILIFSAVSFSATSNYTNFLNSRGTTLKDMVKSVVRDQNETKEHNNEQIKQQSFSSKGGGGAVYSLGGQDYKDFNRLTIFPDVKMAHRELPGVADGGDFDAKLYFRGGGAQETVTLVNGQPVYEAFVFEGKGSLVNPQLIKETKVYTSGMPVCYPDALSGVIDIKEREGDLHNYHLDIAQGLTDLQLYVEGPIMRGKSSFLISLRRTYYDYLLMLMNQGQGVIAPHLENYGQKFFMKLSPEHELVMDFKTYYDFYKLDNKDFNLGQIGRISSVARRNFLQTKLTSHWSNKLKTELTVGMENSVLSKNSLVVSDIVSENMRQEPFYFMTDLQYRDNKDHLVSSGLYFRKERTIKESTNLHLLGNYYYPGFAGTVSSEDYIKEYSVYGAYIQDEQTIVPDTLFLDLGVRYSFIDHKELSKSKSFQPRIGVRVKNEGATLKLSAGKYSQYNPQIVSAHFVDLPPEEAMQYSLGIEHQLGDAVNFSISIFEKNYHSLLREQIDSFGMITGYDNDKKGHAGGIEVMFKKKKSDGWNLMMAYTNQEAVYEESVTFSYPAKQDQKHTFSLASEVDLSKDWSLVVDWQYHSGRPYTDLTGATSLNVRTKYLSDPNKYNRSRLPDYSNLTLILEHKKPIWPFDGLEGQTYIGVANILNEKNVYDYVWNGDYSVKSSVKMMSMTPIFGVRFRF